MNSIFFALISFFSFGVADIFGAIAARKIGGFSLAFWNNVVALIIFSFYLPFIIADFGKITLDILLLMVLVSILDNIAFVFFYEGLRIGNASIVGAITSAFAALVVIFSIVFLGERINLMEALAILIIFLGILLTSLKFKELAGNKFKLDKGTIFALGAMFFWGVAITISKIPISKVGWFLPTYFLYLGFPLIYVFMRRNNIKLTGLKSENIFLVVITSVLLAVGAFGFNIGLSLGNASIVAPIAGSSVTLFVPLAFLILKDRISLQQILGIVTTLTGIVLLSFFST